jgi:hypothetical protein
MRDLYHHFGAAQALAPAVQAAAINGAAISLAGFNSALIVLNTGAIVGAGDFGAKLQESDEAGSGYTDVAADDQLGAFPATLAASTAYRVGYIGSKRKRFIRIVLTKAGGTSIAAGAVAVLGHPALGPAAA